jgi:hypothetical protein
VRRAAAAVLLAVLGCAPAAADGGRVRARREAGPLAITVFTAPDPLRAGRADVSVLVQDRASGEVLLDAAVALSLRGPDGQTHALEAVSGTNRLLKAAVVDLPVAGAWELEVSVRRAERVTTVSCELPVGPPVSGLAGIWPLVAIPPAAIALFVLRGWLRPRRTK